MANKAIILDCECYKNYWLCNLYNPATLGFKAFELGSEPLKLHEQDLSELRDLLDRHLTVGFNSNNYDLPMIYFALAGANNAQLKQMSDEIITNGLRPWQAAEKYGFDIPKINHVDLIEIAPGVADSLKTYAGRLHIKHLQDLPYPPDAEITEEMRQELRTYCGYDCVDTAELFKALTEPLMLREKLGEKYGIDFRSKSDAQTAEAVLISEIQKLDDAPIKKPNIPAGTKIKYYPPEFISFRTEKLNDVLNEVISSEFVTESNGTIKGLSDKFKESFEIRDRKYKFGIGGLHSCESDVCYKTDFDNILVDRDVTSYYPSIMSKCTLYPEHIGNTFLKLYNEWLQDNIRCKNKLNALKRKLNQLESSLKAETLREISEIKREIETLKIEREGKKLFLNGTFGKTNSKYSKLYSPKMMLHITLTGQLASLMLIESLELSGISVVSANTDGIVMLCPRELESKMQQLISEWENKTGFNTEETRYLALYSRDVNNYIAIKTDGKIKRKGIFVDKDIALASLRHNPKWEICSDAAVEFLANDIPVEQTINECKDIRKFIKLQKVNGGAIWKNEHLGKVVRWYRSSESEDAIFYKESGNTVPESECAHPCMELPDEFPKDVDVSWYVKQTYELIYGNDHATPKKLGVGLSKQARDSALYF